MLQCLWQRTRHAIQCREWQVLFVVNTADEDDLAYLPVLMNRNPEYQRLDIPAGPSTL